MVFAGLQQVFDMACSKACPGSFERYGIARALIAGETNGEAVASAYAAGVETLASGATRFELAEPDEQVAALFVATLDNPADDIAAQAFSAVASERAAMAGKVMIEQSDLLIAIWNGVTPGAVG